MDHSEFDDKVVAFDPSLAIMAEAQENATASSVPVSDSQSAKNMRRKISGIIVSLLIFFSFLGALFYKFVVAPTKAKQEKLD